MFGQSSSQNPYLTPVYEVEEETIDFQQANTGTILTSSSSFTNQKQMNLLGKKALVLQDTIIQQFPSFKKKAQLTE